MPGVGTDLDIRTTLQHIVDSATELTGARHGALGVLGPESGGRLTEVFTSGVSAPGSDEAGPSAARILEELTHAPHAPPHAPGRPPGRPSSRSFLGTPIRVGEEVFGSLYVAERRAGAFTGRDEDLLRVLASQAAVTIGNARLYGTARQRERWIEGAAAVTTALLSGEDGTDALTTVAESARALADADAGVVLLPTEEGGMEIVAAATAGYSDDADDIIGATIAPGSPVLVQLLGGEPVFIEDSATDPRMTTHVRSRFGPSMMLPLQSGGKLIGTLALPRRPGARPYSALDRLLATKFASQAALALVLADSQADRERLAVYEDRDRIARDLHDLVVQRLFATEMMLESTRRRASGPELAELLGRVVDELDSTIQEVRTTIFTLQQPPAEAPTSVRGQVLRETDGAAVLLGFRPSVRFSGPVDTLVGEPAAAGLLAALRGALAAAHRRAALTSVEVEVDAAAELPDGRDAVRLVVTDDGLREEDGGRGTTTTWEAPR
ncbi:GAF domain-containing sensor histidine kinase [Streptomyces sp. NRRL F-5135]|uniref:sensor histidine kinase n=1 Tax=Streptomyces sp. NRRL F-5135 TaxID=1463858 RepID=UPI0004C920AB|nr:GAF domain-containing protein [Streptomyces sp. NRRL F-5135]